MSNNQHLDLAELRVMLSNDEISKSTVVFNTKNERLEWFFDTENITYALAPSNCTDQKNRVFKNPLTVFKMLKRLGIEQSTWTVNLKQDSPLCAPHMTS